MTTFQTVAVNSAAAVRLSIADRDHHKQDCVLCSPGQECARAAAMFADHQSRVQRSRSNLLTYLPRRSAVTYAGRLTRMHGEWWVHGTCTDCDHTALRLYRPRGMMLSHVLLSEITSAPYVEAGAAEAMAEARAATREIAVILTMRGIVLPTIVDINGLGQCHVAYPQDIWDHEVSAAESEIELAETRDTATASYTLATLRTLHEVARAASLGNAAGIPPLTRALAKLRDAARKARKR